MKIKEDIHVKKLIDTGHKQNGYITYDQIFKSLSEEFLESEVLDEIFLYLTEVSISVVDDLPKLKKTAPKVFFEYIELKSDDPVEHFLRDISGFEKFSFEEEVNIFKEIDSLKTKLKEVLVSSPFYPENTNPSNQVFEEVINKVYDYYNSIEEIEKSKDYSIINSLYDDVINIQNTIYSLQERLIKAHLPLVVYISKKYKKKYNYNFSDIIQEGNSGLLKAVRAFNYRKTYRFSTYATWWIRDSIKKALKKHDRLIKLSNEDVKKRKYLMNEIILLTESLGREPLDEELSRHLSWDIKEIQEVRTPKFEPISLETPVGDYENQILRDVIEDEKSLPSKVHFNSHLLRKKLLEILNTLPSKHQKVLSLKYGLKDSKYFTNSEIANKLKISKDDIIEIEKEAIEMLKKSKLIEELEDFL